MRGRALATRGWAWLSWMWLVAPLPAGAQGVGGEHTLVNVQGQVQVIRKGGRETAVAEHGMKVERGDVLKPTPGSHVTVVCGDFTQKIVNRRGPIPCRGEPTGSVDKELLPTRKELPLGIPVILSPRMTKVLHARPLLRWTSVPGANQYKVTLSRVGGGLRDKPWRTVVEEKTELRYPEDAPALLPGATYVLQVEANHRSSNEEGTPNLGFTLLESEAVKAMEQAVARLEALGLEPATTRLLVASLYAHNGLLAEAIAQLEGQPEASRQAAVARVLGEAYHRIGLYRRAEAHYLTALELSRSSGQREGVRVAEQALASIYAALDIKPEKGSR